MNEFSCSSFGKTIYRNGYKWLNMMIDELKGKKAELEIKLNDNKNMPLNKQINFAEGFPSYNMHLAGEIRILDLQIKIIELEERIKVLESK